MTSIEGPSGLRGRKLIAVAPVMKASIEALADKLLNSSEAGVKRYCLVCYGETWRRSDSHRCRSCCRHPHAFVGYLRRSNGMVQPKRACFDCCRMWALSRHDRSDVSDICLRDNLIEGEPCERCGSITGTEEHHWAPHAIFYDSWRWPTSYLCPTCHRTWHSAMRRAAGLSLPADQRAGERSAWAS